MLASYVPRMEGKGNWGKGRGYVCARETKRPSVQSRGGQAAFARSSKGARGTSAQRSTSSSHSPARRDALGRRAAEGVPDSQSASERGGSATARKAPANKAGVIWWSTDAEKRKRRRESRKARAALERNEALVWSGKSADFPRHPVPGAVGRRTTELDSKHV